MHAWLFLLVFSVAAQAYAQAPVEERRPVQDDAGLAQRRLEFTRQALHRAEAELRDATLAREEAQARFDEAKGRLDETGRIQARARAAADRAKKSYDAAAAEFERRRAGSGG